MRIGLYPFPSSGDMSANLAHIRTGAALAAEQSVELLVFHECALCGYPPLETSMEAVTPEQVSAGLKQVAALAKDHAMHIAVGTVRFQRGTRYNSVMVFGPEGNLLGCYDKQALWGWDCDHFSRGAQPGVFNIGGVRVGFRICFDVRFPEPFRQLYRAGADLCIVCFSDTAEQPDRERYDLISAHLRTRAERCCWKHPQAPGSCLSGTSSLPPAASAAAAAGSIPICFWSFPGSDLFCLKKQKRSAAYDCH